MLSNVRQEWQKVKLKKIGQSPKHVIIPTIAKEFRVHHLSKKARRLLSVG